MPFKNRDAKLVDDAFTRWVGRICFFGALTLVFGTAVYVLPAIRFLWGP